MWFKIKSYLFFLLKSTNEHGVHSPFVFNLITGCLYKKTNTSKTTSFKLFSEKLKSNFNVIEVKDFGKGSKVFKSNFRKIVDIAKVAGISSKKALLLIRLVEYFNFQHILEIGTSVGLGTAAMHIGNPNSKIITLEGCKNTASVASEMFTSFHFKNIEQKIGNFSETLPQVTNQNKFDFVYFDGDHQKEATLNYFNKCLKTIHNNSVFIFDDIYWSEEMQETWNEIKQHPKVTVTINMYFWGMVFFRLEQAKQHFTIRI